jgi:hypothetical protein
VTVSDQTERRSRPVRLPLGAARVCLDCDLLTDRFACPVCGREQTALISRWLRPLDDEAVRPEAGAPALRTS